MRKKANQSGIVSLELILIVAVLTIVGIVGFKVMGANKTVDNANKNIDSVSHMSKTSATAPTAVQKAPEINSAADLNNADKSVDSVNPDDSNTDSAQLDSQLSTF